MAPPRLSPGPARGGLPGLRGTVNLTMPLSTWLGWAQRPGDVPGYGPIDAERPPHPRLLLARGPRQPMVRHPHQPRRAPRRPRLRPPRPPRPTPAPDSSHGTTQARDTTRTRAYRTRTAARQPTGRTPARTTPAPVPDWLRGLTFTTLQTSDCTHPRQSRGYQPSPSLRHLIQIRNPTCTGPVCRRPATRCDLDHVTPYDQGGKTCECNLHPACCHDHHTKQAPGWTVTQSPARHPHLDHPRKPHPHHHPRPLLGMNRPLGRWYRKGPLARTGAFWAKMPEPP